MNLFACPDDEANLKEHELKELLCEIGRRCYRAGYNDANGGNISCRLEGGRILCTPTMISKGYMQPSDLVVVDLDGNQLEGERSKSSEVLVHLHIYKKRPDAIAVIHGHPRAATAFAVTNTPVPKCVAPEIEVLVGEVPIAPYGDPGTIRLAETLDAYIHDFNVFLMANHGAVALGAGLIDAFWKMEIVEAYCDTLIKAVALGPLQQVAAENMQHIFDVKKSLGFPDRRINDPHAARCDVNAPTANTPPCSSSGGATDIDPAMLRSITEKVIERLSQGS